MANPATVDDIESRWRSLTKAETLNAVSYLDDAWWLLTARRPSLEANLTAGTVRAENVRRVLAWMVIRVLMNPEGYDSESIGDYTYRRNELVASGRLHVTDDELAAVSPNGGRRSGSVRLIAHGDV